MLEAGAMSDDAGSTRVLVADDHPGLPRRARGGDRAQRRPRARGDLPQRRRRRCTGSGPTRRTSRCSTCGCRGLARRRSSTELAAAELPCRVLDPLRARRGRRDPRVHQPRRGRLHRQGRRPQRDLRRDPRRRGRPTVLSGEAMTSMAAELQQRRTGAHGAPRRPRESEILSAATEDPSHNLYAKLGVSDRAAAVAEGMRRGADQLAAPPTVGGGSSPDLIDQSADGGTGERLRDGTRQIARRRRSRRPPWVTDAAGEQDPSSTSAARGR